MDDLGLSWIIMNFYTHRVYHGSSWIDPWARWDRSMAQRNVDFRCIPKFPALKILNQAPKRGRIFKEMVVSRSQNKILVIYGDFRIGESSQQVENMMKTCVSTSFFQVTRNVKAFNFYVECLQEVWFQPPTSFRSKLLNPTPWAQPGVRWKDAAFRCVDWSADPSKVMKVETGNWRVGSFLMFFVPPLLLRDTDGKWEAPIFFWWEIYTASCKNLFLRLFQPWYFKKKRGEIDS